MSAFSEQCFAKYTRKQFTLKVATANLFNHLKQKTYNQAIKKMLADTKINNGSITGELFSCIWYDRKSKHCMKITDVLQGRKVGH